MEDSANGLFAQSRMAPPNGAIVDSAAAKHTGSRRINKCSSLFLANESTFLEKDDRL